MVEENYIMDKVIEPKPKDPPPPPQKPQDIPPHILKEIFDMKEKIGKLEGIVETLIKLQR
jgi:hypothetical protein